MDDNVLLIDELVSRQYELAWSIDSEEVAVKHDPDCSIYVVLGKIARATMLIEKTKGRVLHGLKCTQGEYGIVWQGSSAAVEVVDSIRLKLSACHYPKFDGILTFSPAIVSFAVLLKQYPWITRPLETIEKANAQLRLMNEFVEEYYAIVSENQFKKKFNNHRRASNKSYAGLCDYIDWLIGKYARLIVVRVDLGYASLIADQHFDEYAVAGRYSDPGIQQHREQLFKKLSGKKSTLPMVGYACKLEYGLKKGYHFHAMFFLDGSKVREHITAGKIIGELWKGICGDSGRYWNCLHQPWHKVNGVGELNYYDYNKINAVKHVAGYLTKLDFWVKVTIPGCRRVLYRGAIKAPKKKGVGRPRKKIACQG
jgi:hypothetical protein